MSGGTLRMKVYEPGKLVAPFEILDAVSSGKINSGYTTAGYWAGKIPAAPLFSAVPFGPEAGEYMAWLYYGNGLTLYQEMYDQAGYNVKVIPCAVIAPETSGWFAKEIAGVEDLEGLKMRFFGLGGKVMQKAECRDKLPVSRLALRAEPAQADLDAARDDPITVLAGITFAEDDLLGAKRDFLHRAPPSRDKLRCVGCRAKPLVRVNSAGRTSPRW
ncbi:MAG: hypothetical protein AAF565_19505, partial [Pseudomonadota bacterium]